MFGPRRNPKPMPPRLGVLCGLWLSVLGAFLLFALLIMERAPGAPLVAVLAAMLMAALVLAGGLYIVVVYAKRLRR